MSRTLALSLGAVALLLSPRILFAGPGSKVVPCSPAIEVVDQKPIVIVLHKGLGKPVKGRYKGSDAQQISVERLQTGEAVSVEWASIRKIKPKNNGTGFWAGLLAGAAIGAASAFGGDDPLGGPAAIGIAAGGAAVGAIAGVLVQRPICRAPQTEQANQPSAPKNESAPQ